MAAHDFPKAIELRSSRWRLPPLTSTRALALLSGVIAALALPVLPPGWLIVPALVVGSILAVHRTTDRLPVWFVLGFAWALLRANAVLEARLPDAWHGRDFEVSGEIRGLPAVGTDSTRFELEVESASLAGSAVPLRGRLRLNWYDGAPELAPCSRWNLRLRLRPPRGLVNPGGYDAERGAAQRGVVAVGYVRNSSNNRRTGIASGPCIDGWRQAIARAIGHELGASPSEGLLRALAVGDQSAIGEAQWQVLRATGIGHLIAISGLHVGMLAAFGALLARMLWKLFPRITLRVPGPLLEAPAAMAWAIGYGLLAGMGVPTVRTLLMIGIALLARFARRGTSATQALALAAIVIVAWDPLALMSAGFWLSFVGVAILLSMTVPAASRRPAWRELPRLQLWLSLALLPLSVWFFGQGSLIGPFANLLAVPWVSLVVAPLTVAGSLLIVDWPMLGGPLLKLADMLLAGLWHVMEWMAKLPSAQVYFAQAPVWAFALAMTGIAWCLLPRAVPARALGALLVLPLLLPPRQELGDGEFEAWIFDVGQGLSVLARSREHSLLYDAGPRYPSGFDVGDAIVVPSMRALGMVSLERMIISHGDNDHAGGASAVRAAFPEAIIESGEPERIDVPANPCGVGEEAGQDGVQWRMVRASQQHGVASNDRSCVLLISGKYGSLLLPGDATARVEPAIAGALADIPRPLVLSVPHHGSNGASSALLLDALSPQLGIVSAGYRNPFGHPHVKVVERFGERSIPMLNTANAGFLHLRFARAGLRVEQGRTLRPGWWRLP